MPAVALVDWVGMRLKVFKTFRERIESKRVQDQRERARRRVQSLERMLQLILDGDGVWRMCVSIHCGCAKGIRPLIDG